VLGIAAVSMLVFHLLRAHALERYVIPSGSMEPTLHGDPVDGDVVLVDKTGWIRSKTDLRRFDLVVLRDPRRRAGPEAAGPEEYLVKRVVSTGDEHLVIRDGDLFVKPAAGAETRGFERVVKHPIEHRDMRVTFFEHPVSGSADSVTEFLDLGDAELARNGAIEMPPAAADFPRLVALAAAEQDHRARHRRPGGRLAGHLATRIPIDSSFVRGDGRRAAVGRSMPRDVGIELDVAGLGCAGFQLAFEHDGGLQAVSVGPDGRCQFDGAAAAPREAGRLPVDAALVPGRHALAFGYLDGRIFLAVDGHLPCWLELPLDAEPIGAPFAENRLHFGWCGTGTMRVLRVRLFHDIHYLDEPRPFAGPDRFVEPHQLWLLGDHATDSIDSRRRGAFPRAEVVGRPIAILAPWRRMQRLPR
jgi:signal peptidase I